MSESPKPSEIRERILAQHAQLRTQLDALEKAAAELEADGDMGPVKAAAKDVHDRLFAHVKEEEQLLVPALREADGFGPVRVDALRQEHREQRELLDGICLGVLDAHSSAEVKERVDDLVRRIREDMEEEERTHLDPNLLKDDLVTTSFGG